MSKLATLLVTRNKDCAIPTLLFERALEAGYNGWMTHAACVDGEIDISAIMKPEKFSAEDLDNIQTELLASPSVFLFGRNADDIEDNIQPYILWERDDKVKVIAYLLGEYPQFADEKSQISSGFRAFHNYLYTKLERLIQISNNDTKLFKHVLQQPDVTMELGTFAGGGERSSLVLFDDIGSLSLFGKKNEGKLTYYQWGFVSPNDDLKYSEQSYPEPTDKEKVGTRVAKFLNRKPPGTKAAGEEKPIIENSPPPPAEEKPSAPGAGGAIKGTANTLKKERVEQKTEFKPTAADLDPGCPTGFYRPPPGVKDRAELRRLYLENVGFVPHGFRNRPAVKKKVTVPEKLRDLSKIGEALKQTAAVHIPLPATFKEAEKTTTGGELKTDAPVDKKEEQESTWNPDKAPRLTPEQKIPILAEKVHKAIKSFRESGMITKVMDAHSQLLKKNPKFYQESELKAPTFCEQQGMSIEELMNTPFEIFFQYAEAWPKAIAMIANDLRCHAIKLRDELNDLNKTQQGKPSVANKFRKATTG